MSAATDEEPGDRLKKARIAAHFSSARSAAAAFGWAASTYAAHENNSRKFYTDEAEVYGRAFRVDPL